MSTEAPKKKPVIYFKAGTASNAYSAQWIGDPDALRLEIIGECDCVTYFTESERGEPLYSSSRNCQRFPNCGAPFSEAKAVAQKMIDKEAVPPQIRISAALATVPKDGTVLAIVRKPRGTDQ